MQNKQNDLQGKKVIILGGSSGLGLATAKLASQEGAAVTIVSGNKERLHRALAGLPAGTGSHVADLSKEIMIRQFFDSIGNFDHLVYTAGENISLGKISGTEIFNAKGFFDVRYWGAFAAVKYGFPHINKGGSIGLTSGIASSRPGSGWSLSASICGAIDGFTRAMAVELAPVRVNNVSPGVIRTSLWNSMPSAEREGLFQHMENTLPVKRVGEAEDVAKAFVYLMKQGFTTGQSLITDGGTVLI